MDRLTLDTNIIRDWVWATGKSAERRYGGSAQARSRVLDLMNAMFQARDAGLCDFGVTTQVYTDYEKDVGELPAHVQDLIGSYVPLASPSISVFPMTFPFVLADVDEIQEIMAAVFPSSSPGERAYSKQRKDALQLYAHKVAMRDVFLTNDKAILRARQLLAERQTITVMSPSEYVNSRGLRTSTGAA